MDLTASILPYILTPFDRVSEDGVKLLYAHFMANKDTQLAKIWEEDVSSKALLASMPTLQTCYAHILHCATRGSNILSFSGALSQLLTLQKAVAAGGCNEIIPLLPPLLTLDTSKIQVSSNKVIIGKAKSGKTSLVVNLICSPSVQCSKSSIYVWSGQQEERVIYTNCGIPKEHIYSEMNEDDLWLISTTETRNAIHYGNHGDTDESRKLIRSKIPSGPIFILDDIFGAGSKNLVTALFALSSRLGGSIILTAHSSLLLRYVPKNQIHYIARTYDGEGTREIGSSYSFQSHFKNIADFDLTYQKRSADKNVGCSIWQVADSVKNVAHENARVFELEFFDVKKIAMPLVFHEDVATSSKVE